MPLDKSQEIELLLSLHVALDPQACMDGYGLLRPLLEVL